MTTTIGTAAAVSALMLALSAGAAQQAGPAPAIDASSVEATAGSPAAGSVVPRLVQFGGLVKDATGKPVSGAVSLTFSLYQLQEGGPSLWVETQTVSADAQGHYTVLLGANSPDGLPLDLFTTGAARWLGVTPALPGMGEQPRVLLVGVPYALKAADADSLGGKPASAYVAFEPSAPTAATGSGSPKVDGGKSKSNTEPVATIDGAGVPYFVPLWTADYTIGNSDLFVSGGNLGIGTTTPAATLDVNGTTKFEGLATFAPGQTFPITNIQPTDPYTRTAGYVIPDSTTYYYYFFANQFSTDTITLPHATQRGEVIAIEANQLLPGSSSFNIQAQSGNVIWVAGVQQLTSVPVFGLAILFSDGAGNWYVQSPSSFPDLTISKTHVGNFQSGGSGTYTITISNVGGMTTNGIVTVTDDLPTGLTATAFSGSGWSCDLSSLTCNRKDNLGPGASYPPLTLTVNVAASSSGTLTNVAKVSGGSEVNTANDTALDPTTVNGAPSLSVSAQGTGTTVGNPGTFTVTITNVGNAAATSKSIVYIPSVPSEFAYDSSTGTDWNCTSRGIGGPSCTYSGVLAPGASTTIQTTVTPATTGTFTWDVTAEFSDGSDQVMAPVTINVSQ
jgi:uncharacterized repeat protein (TIGR01451 family)